MGGGGGKVLPYIGYIHRYVPLERVWFSSHWSGIGYSNHRKLVLYRVLFNGIAHKRLKSRTIKHF